MSYHGLGKDFAVTLQTPFGDKRFGVNVPVEDWMADGISMAKSEVVSQMQPLIPGLVQNVLDMALPQAGSYVTDVLWPALQPKLRSEVDRAIGIAETKVDEAMTDAKKTAAIIAGLLVFSMAGAALFVARRRKSA
jgi:hypothetical protein